VAGATVARTATSTTPAAAATAVRTATGTPTTSAATATRGTATTGAAVPSCVLTPDETEGPYYFNAAQVRRDITEGKPGTALQLTFTVVNVNKNCAPVRDVLVDVWHCDATGNYSGYSGLPNGPAEAPGASGTPGGGRPPGSPPAGGPGGPGGGANPTPNVATAEKFLRGIQTTDANGQATFDTIFPGWYQGRLTHIHFKVHVDDKTTFTSQFFMPTDIEQQVYANDTPYNARGQNPTTLANDSVIHTEAERAPLLMTAQRSGNKITGNFLVGLKL
jgi:protocatechuate 3,4-dioxygenase beta subunit